MADTGVKLNHINDILSKDAQEANSPSSFNFDKPAIHWKGFDCTGIKNNENNSINEFWELPLQTSWWEQDENDGGAIITYTQLIPMIRHIMNGLSSSAVHSKNQQSQFQSQPVVAISIPEGPYLPLAILSTHAMNATSQNVNHAPIILPLDPDEGMDRLVHMLLDAKPSVIMHVGRKDEDRLQAAIASVKDADKGYYSPTLVDLKELLQEPQSDTLRTTNNDPTATFSNRISHIVYTSGTTGRPKGCISSLLAVLHYIRVKNESHFISSRSKVFLASALPFDPCLSDILATFYANATLCICPRETIKGGLGSVIVDLQATHILCTPSLWSGVGSELRGELGCLEVLALGGEVFSGRVRGWWARRRNGKDGKIDGKIRLLSTYGVTEACVYQTAGEVFADDAVTTKGQDVGLPFDGSNIWICKENGETVTSASLQRVADPGSAGEIVLQGLQLDEFSGYLNLPDATIQKFISEPSVREGDVCYRTGDRGFIDPVTGHLHITGRIGGEEGMVKINGVRVEIGEIENALLDRLDVPNTEDQLHLVIGCIVTIKVVDDEGYKKLTAYCVLSDQCLEEIGVTSFPKNGIICPPSPLLAVLRARCTERVRKGCTPSTFVLIERLPLTRTGKINREALPPLESCAALQEVVCPGQQASIHLSTYGRCGPFVCNELVTCLNFHSSQKEMVTTNANFAMLGGDSLAATRIVRSLYASHHGVHNSRTLGGSFGLFDGAFSASHLIRACSLGDYIDFLDSAGVLSTTIQEDGDSKSNLDSVKVENSSDEATQLFEALIQAIIMGQSTVSVALLAEGANPNLKEHGKRLGNTSGRVEQRDSFRSNPMHLVCVRGDVDVVRALLQSGKCNCKSPDSSGTYPIHLAASGTDSNAKYDEAEDKRRLECVRLLLDVGKVPLPMKNSSKQTVLHCAARGGYCLLLDYLLNRWKKDDSIKAVKQWGSKCDWQDR